MESSVCIVAAWVGVNFTVQKTACQTLVVL